ncbi:MAG: hypothetical protein K8M05_35280, partial [Deltaproteobacteria bacterium]|nr:hypothetical protein [Kofleriaceae bacterium]
MSREDDEPTTATERELERVADVPPQPERPLRPVGWLLAPELIAQLRTILHRRRNDPRDWMPLVPGHAHVEDGAPDAGRVRDVRVDAVAGVRDVVEPQLAALFGLSSLGEHGPSLDLAGYERVQAASY